MMTLKYSLTDNDFLQHQLYIASKSDRIKKKRQQGWLIVTLLFVFLTILFVQNDNGFLGYYFGGFAVLTFLFYPIYQRSQYKMHYQKFIADTYKNRFGEIITITFNDNEKVLETYDTTGESRMNYTVFEEVIETTNHIFLKIKTGGSLIIPKSQIENIENVKSMLKIIADKLQIKYLEELNWKWK